MKIYKQDHGISSEPAQSKPIPKIVTILAIFMVITSSVCITFPIIRDKVKSSAKEETGESVSTNVPVRDVGSKEFVEYNATDCVTLADYKHITFDAGVPEVIDDSDVDSYIDFMVAQNPDLVESNRKKTEEGDYASISATEYDSAGNVTNTLSDYTYNIGSGEIANSFDDNLIDQETGKVIKFELENNGENYTYEVTINTIYDPVYYTLDTAPKDFLYKTFGARSMDEMRTYGKASLYQLSSQYEEERRGEVIDEYVKSCTVKIPDGLLDQKYDQMKQILVNLSGTEKKAEEYAQSLGYTSASAMYDNLKKQAETTLPVELVCESLWDALGYEDDPVKYDAYINAQMQMMGETDKDLTTSLFDTDYESGADYLRRQYHIETMKEYITSNAIPVRETTSNMTDKVKESIEP